MAKNTHQIIVNREKCVGCGLCEGDCVAGSIKVKNGKAVPPMSCILCGHCEAICPKNAVSITGFTDTAEEMEQVRLNPQELLNAIRTRRTVRQFTKQAVSDAIVSDIIEAGRLAPTGVNAQNTGFIILGSRQKDFEAMALNLFHSVSKAAKPVVPFLKNMSFDDHFFFKKAPLVIVLTGDKVNASLAAENMAFMAEAHGLGVLFSGFFTICANVSPKIHRNLGLKHGEKVVTTLVIGYPAVKYLRTVHREPPKLTKL